MAQAESGGMQRRRFLVGAAAALAAVVLPQAPGVAASAYADPALFVAKPPRTGFGRVPFGTAAFGH